MKEKFNSIKEKIKHLYSYKSTKIITGVVVFLAVVLVLTYIYYIDRFYNNTTINGIDVSDMTYDEALEKVETFIEEYSIDLYARNDLTYTLSGSDIDITADYSDALKQCLIDTHEGFTIFKAFTGDEMSAEFNVSINSDALKKKIKNSVLIKGSDDYEIVAPVSAYTTYDEETGYGKVVEEVMGNTLDTSLLYDYLEEQIANLSTAVTLDDGDVYETPDFYSTDDILEDQVEAYNTLLLHWITWDMGSDTTETMTPEDIKDYIVINDDASVSIDEEAFEEWIEAFCLKYKTYGTTRLFTTHDGEQIEISGGDYGWRLNYDNTVEQAYEALYAEVDYSLVSAYMEDSSDANQEALTTTLEPIYSNTAYQTDYDTFMYDWDPLNYSEVDISEQKVYVYQNGELAYSCICVTGLASDSERATKTGVYYIKDKKLEYTMVGDDYVTDTEYWVRIMWTGTGYHYMNRSDWSSWSSSLYKTKGSHGCINLQYNDAKTVYSLVSLYDAVFIHY